MAKKNDINYINKYAKDTYFEKKVRIRKDSDLFNKVEEYTQNVGSFNGLVTELLTKYFDEQN